MDGDELAELLIRSDVGVSHEEHQVHYLDEEYWGELLAPAIVDPAPAKKAPEPVPATKKKATKSTSVSYPVKVRAMNDNTVIAELLNHKGEMRFGGKKYRSPSGAGKDARGWKSCNGWVYWFYQRPDTKEWRPIDELR